MISDKPFQEVSIEEVTFMIRHIPGMQHYEQECARQLVQQKALQAEGNQEERYGRAWLQGRVMLSVTGASVWGRNGGMNGVGERDQVRLQMPCMLTKKIEHCPVENEKLPKCFKQWDDLFRVGFRKTAQCLCEGLKV